MTEPELHDLQLGAELAAVFGEASRDVRTQALLDVEQDLVVARFSQRATGASRFLS